MFGFFHAAHLVEERLEAALATVGLSGARLGVLEQLAGSDEPLALGDIAARLSCVRSNMTQLIDKLEADGLVRRVADPADRRSVRAALTPLGRERRAVAAAQLERVNTAFEAALSKNDRVALARVLSGLQDVMAHDS